MSENWTVTGRQSESFRPLASLRSYYCYVGNRQIYGVYERPPFPIIIDVPTARDIVSNWQASDFVMAGGIYATGILLAYAVSRPFPTIAQRLLVYHTVSHIFLVNAAISTLLVPFKRLTGFWDNGLRWKHPEDKLRKYDNTTHFENNTFWKRFRV